ncbi:hypothetical protein L5515_009910 [Caenorhabditis briggsae]|uniref:Uncharacterized protein n=1 Tax=Caenorhabditis briggsae TaxID=6238 RepID=A0AAE9F9Z4_CAEBR|nr:hypothetical protein L5515_009910 [Caenorhabditis briggsae]
MFLVFFVFTTIFFLSLIFNIYLFFVIFAQPDKNKLPTVYIYNMILSSSVDIVIMFLTFLMPMAMDDGPYYVNIDQRRYTFAVDCAERHPKEYSQLSEDLRMWIFYIRLTPTALFCFLIYYIGTPSIRRLLIERTKLLYKGSYEATTVIQM